MPIYREKDFSERISAQSEAKRALLDKFKSRPSADDPRMLAKQAERKAILEARAIRETEREKLKQERLVREAKERAEREAAEEAARLQAEAAAQEEAKRREIEENERVSRLLADEAERKAKRDARYAARKSRGGRQPPKPF